MITEKFTCPCCGYKTFEEELKGQYDICEICFWEDDPIQVINPDYSGGANKVSLRQAQINFMEFGACEKEMLKNARRPNVEDKRGENWKPLE
jgi:hypothetical protein